MEFLKSYWMFILLGITILVVGVIGYLAIVRLSVLDSEPETPTADPRQATTQETTEDASSRGELSFTLEDDPEQQSLSDLPPGLACIELVAAPLEGSVPLTVTFTGIAKDPDADSLTFDFDFGDETSQSVEVIITDQTGVESQDISHTYTEPGSYNAILTVSSTSGSESSISCQIPINAGGVGTSTAQAQTTPGISSTSPTPAITPGLGTPTLTPGAGTTTISPTPAIGGPVTTGTPAPTTIAAGPTTAATAASPTIAPTSTPRSTLPTATPQVGQNQVDQPIIPEAGALLPTAAAAIGGIAIIILAILL